MSNEARRFLPKILGYTALWSIFALLLFIFLRYRYTKLYSKEKYEILITSVSKWRLPAADPCQYFVSGDPVTSEGNFARVIFYCDKQRQAVSSLDLTVLPQDSYAALLTETGRINGFSATEIIEKWKCFDDHEGIKNFSEKVKVRSKVECFSGYSDQEIDSFYEKN